MQPLRLGDRGPAVADVHAALRSLGLLPDDDGTAAPRPPSAMTTLPDAALDAAEFDAATELAVRHFQQVRGLSVDGRVGEETYRALNEARWSLGDRLLRYDPERPTRGDDVINLQDRLHELGYDAGPVDGIFGPETEAGPARLPARLRADLRRHLRPGHAARAAPARPQGHRWPPAAAAAERLVRRERPAPDRPAHRRRPRPRRRGDRLHRGGDHRGRPGLRPRLPHRGPAGRGRRHGLPDPRPGPEPLARRAHRVRQRRPRRPVHLPAPGRARLRARPRGRQLLLRHRVRGVAPPSASSSPTSPAAR